MKKESRRLLSAFLALSLCLGLMSPVALAAEPTEEPAPGLTTETVVPTPAPEATEQEEEEVVTPGDEESVVPEDEEVIDAQADETLNQQAEVAAPVGAILLGGETLTPGGVTTDKIRLNTAAAAGYVVDEITGYSYDATKITIDENGQVKIKDGYTPTNTETIPITVSYKYYGGGDVKYVENFDDNTAHPYKEEKGSGAYVINNGQSRTGLYGATFGSNQAIQTDASVKDLGQSYTDAVVTAWYYDPYEKADIDHAKLCPSGDKGQVKYGMGISDGVTATAHYLLGLFYSTKTGDAATPGDAAHYGYRMAGGSFLGSSKERSSGWHRLRWEVNSQTGTTRYIDEVKIDGSPIAAIKSINKLALSTNWQNTFTYEGRDLIMNRHYIDDVSIVAASATPTEASTVVNVTIAPDELPPEPALTFGADNSGSLAKGETGRVYLDNMSSYAIKDVEYTTNNSNVTVGKDGTLEVTAGYAPKPDETVTVTAKVTYYNTKSDVIFNDSFEGTDKMFTASAAAYQHSSQNALFGRQAATATTSKGYPQYTFANPVKNVTLTAWYYDAKGGEDQTKFGFGINDGDKATLGIVYDSAIAGYVNDSAHNYFTARIAGYTYNDYAWGTTDAQRSAGWHKFQWIIDETTGLTLKIDDETISTNVLVGKAETNHDLVKVENNTAVTELTHLRIAAGWNDNKDNLAAILNKHFIDGVTVVKNKATTDVKTITSIAIPVLDTQYTHTPGNIAVDSTYPSDLTVMVKPGLEELRSVAVDNTPLTEGQWSKYLDNGPTNASYYPAEMKGWKLTVDGAAIKALSLADGAHKLVLTMSSGSTYEIPFTAAANTHVAKSYYLSNNGDDSKDGQTEATAWATFEKLNTVTFGPGDKIYLDATSFWNGVHFQPKGSGAPGAPIVMTKYNDGGDRSKRPILNGNGTTANKDTSKGEHSYLAFDAWRKFYPSGTVELFNVEHWEVRGLEITNYAGTYTQEATGRNGIAIIHDFMETQGLTVLPNDDKIEEETFYRAGKLQHIVVEDNYIHDVTGWHPINGAAGGGSKMSGGINAYGPYDDLKLDNNIIMYCDVEGIRNDVLAWRGDTRTQFPAYMEGISISNNFIVGVPGDGVVISSAIEPRLANNYLSDAGYSYFASTNGKDTPEKPNPDSFKAKDFGNRNNPITMGETNFAGLWFIGTKNAVAEYNESVNNVWICNDGEAFDADMFTWGTMFQYNYTYRNNGGFCLFMTGNQMDDGTIVRYNVSIEDGEGVGTPNDGRKATFHYNKEPDAIYNNLFVLGNGVRGMFGGDSDVAYFYNNMVIKPDGQIGNFNLNTASNSNATATAMTGGSLKNNLFYPAAILNNVTGSITKEANITPDNLDGIFYNLTAFMNAQPVHALNGRSALTGTPVNMAGGVGAGVAMSGEAGRSVRVPNNTGFDYTQFEGIKTVEGSPTIGKGIEVDHGHPGYEPYPGNEEVYPLKTDFFKNDITSVTTPDIGPYQWSADASHFVKLTYEGNGATVAAETVKSGATHTLPAPRKDNYIFAGWYTEAGLTNKVSDSYTVPAAGITLYAKWTERAPDTYDVTFDSQGGSDVETIIAVAKDAEITAPADPTKAHYIFEGWYKESTCTNKWNFAADTVTANTTLFAKWEGETFTVTFNKNGGDTEAAPASKTVTYPATTVDALPTAPDKAGFTFVGWTTTQDGSTFFDATTPVTANVTVYAKWVQNAADTFNVLFDAQGGSTVNPILGVTKDAKITAPTDPTKEHYVFKGWFKENACTTEWVFATDTVTANTTLFAKWEGETFTVTFDKNGGDTEAAPAGKTVTYPATTVDALPTAPTKAEHTFMGWTTTQNGSTFFDTATAVTANITVYAKWVSDDDLAIAAAKTLVEGATYTVAQANVITEATARARLTAMVNALNLNGVSAAINKVSYRAAVSGTEGTPAGTDGSYAFTVTLSKGTGAPVTTESLSMTITATAYVAPSPAPSPSTPKPKPVEKPAEDVTATEGGQVTVKENKDGSSTYTFKPEKEKEVLYVRVNGLLVKADSYTAAKGETPSIVVVFGESGTDHSKDYADTAALPEYMTEAVNYVVGSGLFRGNGESFVPMGNMNRAMFATVLSRLYGADTTKLTSNFADVAQGSWYEGSVAWISDMGITSGVGGGNFAPEADMTRQELVTLVYRFAQKVGADVSATGALTAFPDGGSVDAWSTDAMSWAVGLGMITGKDGSLAPNDTITRVEAAIILQRMANLLTAKR